MKDETNERKKYAQDAKFLEPFLVEPALLDPDLMSRGYDSDASDLLKRLVDVFQILEEEPYLINSVDMRKLIEEDGSQIGNPNDHFGHIYGTAINGREMTKQLKEMSNGLDLSSPDSVYGAGLTHDLSATFAKYDEGELDGKTVNFKQTDLQLTQYLVATVLGLDTLQEISLHCGYLELAELIAEGVEFPGSELYEGWRKALNDPENRFYIGNIKEDMDRFIPKSRPVSLLEVITSADHSQWGEPVFDLKTIRGKFESRRADIVYRYLVKHDLAGNPPTGLGFALAYMGGLDRTRGYFDKIMWQITFCRDEM